MPNNPSTPYAVGAQIGSLVRDLCLDPQGQLYTDQFILEMVNSANRFVSRDLKNSGKITLIEDEYQATIPAALVQDPEQPIFLMFTGIQGNVTGANSPFLPANMVQPLEIWERPSGTNVQTRKMHNLTNQGGLPKRFQVTQLHDWEWRNDLICFVGATQDNDIFLRFSGSAEFFSIDNNGFLVGSATDLDALDAIGFKAASMLLKKRGAIPLAKEYEAETMNLLEQLRTDVARQEQMNPVQMGAFGGGRRRSFRRF